jgi:hypothetical protein
MANSVDDDLYPRVADLLGPGEIELRGAVVHTGYGGDEESLLHQATLEVGDIVVEHAEAGDTYVYSGNDSEEFGVNQHQGLTVEGDDFVWECQQLMREGTYDLVIYWAATGDQAAVIDDIEGAGYDAVGVTESGRLD